jgi:predicted nucleotidyltransferase
MRVCGIIAEYDPFHKGHERHIALARSQSNADYIICLMSCAFTQRGMPALIDIQTRARMALLGGADIVLGLPFCFSVRDAENFAFGGVSILNSLHEVTHISFGCETDEPRLLQNAADLLENPTIEFSRCLHFRISSGLSYAQCLGDALAGCINAPDGTFLSPNNILAISYLRAINRLKSEIIPVPVKRTGNYKSTVLSALPSASAVRNALLRGDWCNIKEVVPEITYELMREAVMAGCIHHPEALDTVLRHVLLNSTSSQLSKLPDMTEGLENRLMRAARNAVTRQQIIMQSKSKRYTYARINRALSYALAGVTVADIPLTPLFARIIGFRKSALPLMHILKGCGFPLITRSAHAASNLLTIDMHVDDLWALGAGQPSGSGYRNSVFTL